MSLEVQLLFVGKQLKWGYSYNGPMETEAQFNNIMWSNPPNGVTYSEFIEIEKPYDLTCRQDECWKKRYAEYPTMDQKTEALWQSKVDFNDTELVKCKNLITEVNLKYPMPVSKR